MRGSLVNARLQAFVAPVEDALASDANEALILDAVQAAMRTLVASDDWLPPELA